MSSFIFLFFFYKIAFLIFEKNNELAETGARRGRPLCARRRRNGFHLNIVKDCYSCLLHVYNNIVLSLSGRM